jgi:hypothetical protein
VLINLLLLTGCASQFTAQQVDPETKQFTALAPNCPEIIVNRQIDTGKVDKIVYVKANIHSRYFPAPYQDLLMQSFREMRFFDEVVTNEPITYINSAPLLPELIGNQPWYDVVDPLSIETLKRRYGHFLIAECTLWETSLSSNSLKRLNFMVKIIDPRDGSTVLYVRESSVNWTGVNYNLVYPVLNVVNSWLHDSRRS